MAKTPKTLQVSFGSFSCTLEGFDDPVQAMKAVTEYVRDLTARDAAFAQRIGLGGTPAPAAGPPSAPTPPVPPPAVARPAPQGSAMPPRPAWPEPVAPAPAPRAAVAEAPRPAEPPEPAPAAPLATTTEPPEDGDDAPDLDPAAHPGLQKLLLASAEEDEEEELSRILSRADDQLADPEATRRRDVIAQLKAAVAATEAERALGEPDPGPEARQGAFRLDLSEAVRAHALMAGGRAEPLPLRLVASQRVDDATGDGAEDLHLLDDDEEDEEDAVPPVRHRGSFAAFAAEMGATSLPDLLEAAAAWLCFVDEAESVSRAQLLALASEALPGPPDREEGLRAFGTLLRQSRIATVAGGRYRISEGSRFDPGRLAV